MYAVCAGIQKSLEEDNSTVQIVTELLYNKSQFLKVYHTNFFDYNFYFFVSRSKYGR